MGVHDLWSIVETVRESVPLYSLSGKTLAVDLSLWVCEAQHVQAMMGRVTKPHLRNLFFRVSSLTLMGVKLVFVMEGEAPKLKAETMSKRTETRFGGFKKASTSKSTNTSRGRFKAVLRECAEMLDYLGVPWVTAAGEAEAMCAYLDSQGMVDGCITNDGDAFLYGARTVYRNFNMNSKDPQVDCYRTSRLQTELHLSRENLVGLAILLGCDYIPKGILGVGKEQTLKLIQTLKGQTLLQRFMQWKEDNAGVSEKVVKKVPHCHICRHPGSAKAHERVGCVLCDSKHFCEPQDFDYQCPCDWHHYEQTRQALSFEANIRKKTLASQQFPFTEIISEFLVSKDKPVSHFKRRQPNMQLMQKFACDKMEWPKHYTCEKVLVLMTYAELMNRKYEREMSSQIKPLRILKPRVRNAVACFEVIWSTPEHYVFPEDQPAEGQHEVRTVEEESLFRVAFPEVVESYLRDKALAEENKTKKKKSKRKKEKPSDVSDGISDLLAQMSLQKSEAVASPSVSAVIDALHLSDIDWDALSFTSSPTLQAATDHTTEPKRNNSTDGDVKETESEKTKQNTSSDVKQADSRSAPELCYAECPLRDRVLMRNTAKAKCHSDPGQSDKDRNVPQTTKKSVCLSMCSSSEDSDAENQQFGPQRRVKIKPINKIMASFITDYALIPVSVPKTNKQTMTPAHSLQLGGPKSQRHSTDVEINRTPVSTKSRCQDVQPAIVDCHVASPAPASPITVLDSDDSVICIESPLPLAERLRLKFLK
ncbi:flap endonuclease GEN homolog 1 [Seriola dumerili]|uniref:flap endonuclease GEN homolog 1 n=1 Tax=Seriola dumerili TaxID=41447 RepID=UPI000BBEC537|nr:flap endonuclease GEN homolog 1 [Seriola dumerili]